MVHSVETGDTTAVVDNHVKTTSADDGFHGITYDPKDKKMYFSSRKQSTALTSTALGLRWPLTA